MLRLFIFLLTLTSAFGHISPLHAQVAQRVVDIAQIHTTQDITSSVLMKKSESQDFKNSGFTPVGDSNIASDYSADTVWMKFVLTNSSSETIQKVLLYEFMTSDLLQLYELKEDKLQWIENNGHWTKGSERSFTSFTPSSLITLQPYQTKTYILKRTGFHNLNGRIKMSDIKTQIKQKDFYTKLLYFFAGGMLFIIAFDLFFFYVTREVSTFYYAMFNIFWTFVVLIFSGFFSSQDISIMGQSLEYNTTLFSMLALSFALIFIRSFLFSRKKMKYDKIFIFIVILIPFIFVENKLMLTILNIHHYILVDLAAILGIISMFVLGVLSLSRTVLAKYYLLSWLSIISSVVCYYLYHLDLFSYPTTISIIITGASIETIMFSYVLAMQYLITQKERNFALRDASEKIRYQNLARVLFHDVKNRLNIVISRLKEARGAEMNFAVEKSTAMLTDLSRTLDELRQDELRSVKEGNILNLKQSVEILKDLFSRELKEKEIKLKISGDGDYPIRIPKSVLLNSILANLVSNSLKFCHAKSAITLTLFVDSDHFVLKVSDQGVGIEKDVLEKISREQIVTTLGLKGEQGSGLGLNIVKSYVKEFGGSLEIHSTHSGTDISMKFLKSLH